jgi:hypothetical protein
VTGRCLSWISIFEHANRIRATNRAPEFGFDTYFLQIRPRFFNQQPSNATRVGADDPPRIGGAPRSTRATANVFLSLDGDRTDLAREPIPLSANALPDVVSRGRSGDIEPRAEAPIRLRAGLRSSWGTGDGPWRLTLLRRGATIPAPTTGPPVGVPSIPQRERRGRAPRMLRSALKARAVGIWSARQAWKTQMRPFERILKGTE